MHSHELEDLTLLLVRDADEAEMWIDRWTLSYPTVRTAAAARSQSIPEWQNTIERAWRTVHSRNAAIVAHGAGVSAVVAWLYRADAATLRRVRNAPAAPAPPPSSSAATTPPARRIGRKGRPPSGAPPSSAPRKAAASTAQCRAGSGA